MDLEKFTLLADEIGFAIERPTGRLLQNRGEFKNFLLFVDTVFKARGIINPIVVEIGIAYNGQKRFYEELMGATHISIDINPQGGPDILGDSHDPETLKRLKEMLNGRSVDLLFIDGGHLFHEVKQDYQMYEPLASHLVALHDIHLVRWASDVSEVNYYWQKLVELEREKTTITFRKYYDCPDQKPGQMGIGLIVKEGGQKITVLTKWYNEEILAPFFLKHYSFADEIVIFLDSKTDDKTEEIISQYKNARIVKCDYPNQVYNNRIAIDRMNQEALSIPSGWIICADADEFLFPSENRSMRDFLGDVVGNVVYANMWQVYRNKTEMDLDASLQPIWLRRYGDPDRETGINKLYCKPSVIKAGCGIRWQIGHHYLEANYQIQESKVCLNGAHWTAADPVLIPRCLRWRIENMDKESIDKQWGSSKYYRTEEELRKICEDHLNDPQLF